MESSKKKKIVIGVTVAIVLVIIIILVSTLSGNGSSETYDQLLPDRLRSDQCPSDYGPRPLLVISLDGYRADYLDWNLTPAIKAIADKGVHAEYMMPSYPTVTFPNHYTIVTGLYPESHGIIANSFYDPVFRARFSIGSNASEEGRWWGGEPMWNTITRQGKKSATFFWPGSGAAINDKRPNYWERYNGSIPYADRVLQVTEWLSLTKDHRPDWVSLYFDEPDHSGHYSGLDSEEMKKQLMRVDDAISLLMRGLRQRDLINCVNILLLSDHGMTEAGSQRVFDLKDYLPNLRDENYYFKSVVSRINPKNDSEEAELEILRKLGCPDGMRVYQKEAQPKRFHFANNRRIEDIVFDLDPGHTTQYNSSYALKGQHGYDNYFPSMNALFIAYGPDFKQYHKIKPFQNIELYNLMCYMTDVKPAENNGTWGSLHHILANPPPPPTESPEGQKLPILRIDQDDQQQVRWNMSGCEQTKYSSQKWMGPLVLTKDEEENAIHKHIPWGIPQVNPSIAKDVSMLVQPDHITAYSSAHKMPLWTSFLLQPRDTKVSWLVPQMSQWHSDARLPNAAAPSCQTFKDLESANYSMFTLFPTTEESEQSGEQTASYLVSNAIPVHMGFVSDWLGLMNLLPEWADTHGPLNIVIGPVFSTMDNPHVEYLTKRNVSIPSDLFVVLANCTEKVQSLQLCHPWNINTRAFIVHQYIPVEVCLKDQKDYLIKYSATVKDVEGFTHFKFFPALTYNDRVNITLKVHRDIWELP